MTTTTSIDPATPDPLDAGKDGRDAATGRFAPGNTYSRGRPRRPDVWTIASEHAEREGVDLHAAIWRIVQSLLKAAEGGDVHAARLVLGYLCAPVPTEVEVHMDRQLTTEQIELRAEQLIEVALRRKAAAEAEANGDTTNDTNNHKGA